MEMKILSLLLLFAFSQDQDRRKAFLEGDSAKEALSLVQSKSKENVDAVATFFSDREKPYSERLVALQALRSLKKQTPQEYKRVYRNVQTFLSLEASRGHGMSSLKKDEEEMLLHALEWHADMKYEHAMYVLEHYVDTEINRMRRNKLSDRVRTRSANLLGRYPKNGSSRDTLWDTLAERKESDTLRKACFEALKTHMKDRDERVLALKPDPKDKWLMNLKAKLLERR